MITPTECLIGVQTKLAKAGFYPSDLIDGIWGPKTKAAIMALQDALQAPPASSELHYGKLSSFADPDDVAAFQRCKANGHSDQYCFAYGDNGIGAWGSDTTGNVPMVALPPEDIIERWGSVANGERKPVVVVANFKEVVCILADLMPHRENIHNGAVCDLNPGASKALGLTPPV